MYRVYLIDEAFIPNEKKKIIIIKLLLNSSYKSPAVQPGVLLICGHLHNIHFRLMKLFVFVT